MFNETWVTVMGTVCDDPAQRSAQAPVKFRLASTPAYKTDDGAWRDSDTNFFDVVCWQKLGQHVFECVRRGDPVVVHGRLAIRDWETERGRGRSVEINAQTVGFDLKRRKAVLQERPLRVADRAEHQETQVTAVEGAEAANEPAA